VISLKKLSKAGYKDIFLIADLLDENSEIRFLLLDGENLIKAYTFSLNEAASWLMDDQKLRKIEMVPLSYPDEIALKMKKILNRQKILSGRDWKIYISLHSLWGAEILKTLPRTVINNIRGLQVFSGNVYKEVIGVVPEMELELLQFTYLLGEKEQKNLYGIKSKKILFNHCWSLKQIRGSNSAVNIVEIKDCPLCDSVLIQSPVGEVDVLFSND